MATETVKFSNGASFTTQTEDQSYFPMLIKTEHGKRLLCSTPDDLPSGVAFKVLEVKCDIEIRYLPAMHTPK